MKFHDGTHLQAILEDLEISSEKVPTKLLAEKVFFETALCQDMSTRDLTALFKNYFSSNTFLENAQQAVLELKDTLIFNSWMILTYANSDKTDLHLHLHIDKTFF